MIDKLNRSKIRGMKTQKGMASIAVVSVIVVIMTLTAVGFAKIMSRTITNSANRQFSTAATYAAQSAINDVAAYLKDHSTAYSNKCSGTSSLIGSSGSPGPFYNDANLSGDNSAHYTCLLLDQSPEDLQYQQISTGKSRVIKVSTAATPGTLSKMMLSWQPTQKDITGFPTSSSALDNQTNWNDPTSHFCKDTSGVFAACVSLLRVTIYPIPDGESLANVQQNSKTIFLYPQNGAAGSVKPLAYNDPAFKDGMIYPVNCGTKTIATTGGVRDFNGTADYACNIIFNNLATAVAAPDKINYFYLRLTPVYSQTDVKIKTNDQFGQALSFVNTQAVVDVTASAGGVAKRLQARVDISSLSSPGGVDDNIAGSSNSIPEQTVRSASAICKRMVNFQSIYTYTIFDVPDNVCRINSSVSTPAPSITLKITGNDYTAGGVTTRDSSDATPPSSSRTGTIYTNANDSSNIAWHVEDATSCAASGNGGWSGNVPLSARVNDGSKAFSGITTVSNYILTCNRTGDVGNPAAPLTIQKTVTAWPPPTVTGLTTTPNPIPAGSKFQMKYTVSNSSSCTASSSNGTWTGNVGASQNPSTITDPTQLRFPYNDKSVKTFSITCKDPVNRTATASITICPNGLGPIGGRCSVTETPPTCTANIPAPVDNRNGSGSWQWNGGCPDVPANAITYQLTNCSYANAGLTCGSPGSPVNPWAGTQNLSAKAYQNQLTISVAGWSGNRADTGLIRWTIHPTINIYKFGSGGIQPGEVNGLWQQTPECGIDSGYNLQWWCRNSPLGSDGKGSTATTWPRSPTLGCPDGVHSWTACGVTWGARAQAGCRDFGLCAPSPPGVNDDNDISCKLTTSPYGQFASGRANGQTGNVGWGGGGFGAGRPDFFTITCSNNFVQSASKTINNL